MWPASVFHYSRTARRCCCLLNLSTLAWADSQCHLKAWVAVSPVLEGTLAAILPVGSSSNIRCSGSAACEDSVQLPCSRMVLGWTCSMGSVLCMCGARCSRNSAEFLEKCFQQVCPFSWILMDMFSIFTAKSICPSLLSTDTSNLFIYLFNKIFVSLTEIIYFV